MLFPPGFGARSNIWTDAPVLNAFKRGQVKTLIVVPRMTELPKYVAMM